VTFQGPRQSASDLQREIALLAPSVRPISMFEEGSGGRRFIGSSFVLSHGNQQLVITAEHVVSGPETRFLGVSASGGVLWPKNYSRLEPIDPTTPYPDVAFAFAKVDNSLEPDIPPPLPRSIVLERHQFAEGSSMVAVGFPGSRAKARNAQTKLVAEWMSVIGDLAPEDVYSRIGKSASTHLAMEFHQNGCVDENSRPAPAAHPKGMSGGPMFVAAYRASPGQPDKIVPRLVGVLTEYYPDPDNVIVALRIEAALGALDPHRSPTRPLYRAVDV
jgi:hypothetical protein